MTLPVTVGAGSRVAWGGASGLGRVGWGMTWTGQWLAVGPLTLKALPLRRRQLLLHRQLRLWNVYSLTSAT